MLKLHNTMSQSMELFTPRHGEQVKMFTCGPSVYRPPHLGNYRTFLWEDVLERYLRYLGYGVERVINLTDIEDKAIAEAEKEGKALEELTGMSLADFSGRPPLSGSNFPPRCHVLPLAWIRPCIS